MRPGRRLFAALLVCCCMAPGVAAAQDQCRAIRGLTNMDGRRFADVAIGYLPNPWRLSVRVGRVEPLPSPADCSLNADEDEVELSCRWPYGDFATTNALFSTLFDRLQTCLGNGLTPAVGPRPYGGDNSGYMALKESSSTLPSPGGETQVQLRQIEAPDHHYVTLEIYYDPATPGDAR